jgi:Ca2+/H+ antiporter
VVFLLHGICTASVVSTLKLQKPVLSPTSKVDKYSEENNKEQRWSKKKSLLYLLFAVAWMAIVSGKMVDFVEAVGQKLELSELFKVQ